jgi:hypothetical protein
VIAHALNERADLRFADVDHAALFRHPGTQKTRLAALRGDPAVEPMTERHGQDRRLSDLVVQPILLGSILGPKTPAQYLARIMIAPMPRVSSRPRNGGRSCQPVIDHGTSPASVHEATTKKTAEPDDVVERRPP